MPVENPADLPPHDLCEYIVRTHHDYLRRELPRLHAMAERVARVHGEHTPSLVVAFEVYASLERELTSHMMKEEQILFPAVASMSLGESAPMPLDGPISCMIHEHHDAGEALASLRDLTSDYHAPKDACNTYRALFSGLEELDEDLRRHIHLENFVLFPAAKAMMAA
jgi:regulator of cell morphogenesis and NO signaling